MLLDGEATWLIWAFLYFLPPFVAYGRRHRSAHAIAALTLLLGWTAIGWVVALVWSFTGNVRTTNQAL